MTAADPLLDALGVPRQVVIDHQRAKLEVDPFGSGFRGDHDRALVAEVIHQGGAFIGSWGAGHPGCARVAGEPASVDFARLQVVVGTVEQDEPTRVLRLFEQAT